MAQVFISYARQERQTARQLAEALTFRKWDVWWDRELIAGTSFDEVIERQLELADAVVVLWSKSSVASVWVKAEATAAAERRLLIPVRIEPATIPLRFRNLHTVDLTNWTGAYDDPRLDEIEVALQALHRQAASAHLPVPSAPAMSESTPRGGGTDSERHEVLLGVSAPKRVQQGRSFVARLAVYRPQDERQARRQLRGARQRARPSLGVAACRWQFGTHVVVTLGGRFIEIHEPNVRFTWEGCVGEAAFDVTVTESVPEVVLHFTVEANGIPVATPRLEVAVRARARRRSTQRKQLEPARTAFASYASADRMRVLDAVITLEAIGIDVFQDCLDLRPGESWKPRLLHELMTREIFVLFWSWAARESKWVAWELESALDTRGEDPIYVSPLEIDVPPPDRLAHVHFSHPGVWIRAALAAPESRQST